MLKKRPEKEQLSSVESLVMEFLLSRRSGVTKKTLEYYEIYLSYLKSYCEDREIKYFEHLNAPAVTSYFGWLEEKGHNAGGVHAAYRTLRTLVIWFVKNYEPEDYKNPLTRILPPRRPGLILDPIPIADIRKMIEACPPSTFPGIRDRALLRTLVDTGVRINELVMMDVRDLNFPAGMIRVRHGKGSKQRDVFVGSRTKKALRRYLRWRGEMKETDPLWITSTGTRVSYSTIRNMVEDRCKQAGVGRVPLHAFRRTFAIEFLRSEGDPFALPGLLGHEDMQVTRIYVKMLSDDLQREHQRASPGDKV